MDVPALVAVAAQVGAWLVLLLLAGIAIYVRRTAHAAEEASHLLRGINVNVMVAAAALETMQPPASESNGPSPPYPAPMREPDV